MGSRRMIKYIHSAAPTSALNTKVKSNSKCFKEISVKREMLSKPTFSVRSLNQDNRRRPRADGNCKVACSNAWATPPCRHRREGVPNHIASVPGSGTRELLCRIDSTEKRRCKTVSTLRSKLKAKDKISSFIKRSRLQPLQQYPAQLECDR